MKIADGELRQLLTYDVKLPAETVRELVADSKQTGTSLLQTTLGSKLVEETPLAQAQAKRIGIPFVDLSNVPLDSKTVRRLPRQIAAKYHVVCFDETATSIKLAMSDPRDEQARKAVKDYCHKTVRRYQATDHGLTLAMRHYAKDVAPLHFSTRDLLATILEQAISNGARDIHFEPQGKDLVIKLRLGQRLQTMSTLPSVRLRAVISWCKLQSGIDVGDCERAHHGRFAIRIDGALHDVAINTIPVLNGEKMVLRLIPPANSIPDLAAIGYGRKDIVYLNSLITDGRGLLIIAGDNGSAVPTTLASLTKLAASQPHATVTSIEESLTYQIPESTQVEVTHALPFTDIVSAVIAQNPSVIISSQLGKQASAEQLIDFALSQHLVISGLYAHNLTSCITQLMKLPLTPALVAASLRLLIVQHHIDALCKSCRVSFTPAGPLKKALWRQFGFDGETHLYRKGAGCESCSNGHHGSTMATEWLPVAQELKQLLATKADGQAINDYVAKHSDYAKQLGKLAGTGAISIDEATASLAAHH